MKEILLFIFTFFFVYFVYFIFTIRKELNKISGRIKKRNSAKKILSKRKKMIDEAKFPVEISYLIFRYKIDLGKIYYPRLLQITGLVSSLDLAIVVTAVSFVEGTGPQLLFGFVLLIPIILISYHFIGLHYRKKGMTVNV